MKKIYIVWIILWSGLINCGKRFPEKKGEGSFDKKVVIEDLTAVWCVNCPEAHENLKKLKEEFGDRIILISYHSKENDPFGNEKIEKRIDIYNPEQEFPTLIIDGEKKVKGPGDVEEMRKEIEERIKEKTGIGLSILQQGDSLFFHIISDSFFEADSLDFLMIIVEDSIHYNCPNGETLLFNVARDIIKERFYISSQDTHRIEEFLDIKEDWVMDHLRIIGIVQDPNTLYIHQGEEIFLSPPFQFLVEDTIKEVSATGKIVEFPFQIINNNSYSIEVYIDTLYSTELPSDWTISVCSEIVCKQLPFSDTVSANSSKEYRLDIYAPSVDTGIVDLSVSSGSSSVAHRFILMVTP